MDVDLAKFGIVVFAIVCALCVAVGGIVLAIAFRKDPKEATETVRTFFEGGNALRVATVLAVLGTITVLSFASKLTEGVLTLMSGIVGYVLGGLHRGEESRKDGKNMGPPSRQ